MDTHFQGSVESHIICVFIRNVYISKDNAYTPIIDLCIKNDIHPTYVEVWGNLDHGNFWKIAFNSMDESEHAFNIFNSFIDTPTYAKYWPNDSHKRIYHVYNIDGVENQKDKNQEKCREGEIPKVAIGEQYRDPKLSRTAGKVAHSIRENNAVDIITHNQVPILQSMKTLAKAREYLKRNNMDFWILYDYCNETKMTHFLVRRMEEQHTEQPKKIMYISYRSDTIKIFEYICLVVRTCKVKAILSVMGVDAVNKAVKAIAITTRHFTDSTIIFRPKFISLLVGKEGGLKSVMRIEIERRRL